MDSIAITVPGSRLIVIIEEEIRLALERIELNLVEQLAKSWGGELVDVSNLKIHRKLDFVVVGAIHLQKFVDIRFVRLADENRVARIFVHNITYFLQHLVNLRQIVRVLVL